MPFKDMNFCHSASNNRNRTKLAVFTYKGQPNEWLKPGFFDSKATELNLNDIILCYDESQTESTDPKIHVVQVIGKTTDTVQVREIEFLSKALYKVTHDDSLTGDGTVTNPLSVVTDDFVKKSATEMQTLSSPLTIKDEICLTDPDDNVAKHSLAIVAGVPTETADEMDIIGNRKYDTLPTTDDATSYENLNPKSMITKGQVASAISTKADTTTVNSELATKATKSTDFMTAITSTNKGATKTEIDALDDKIDIAGTSGKIIGSYWFGKTKANTAVPAPTLIGQNYYDFTTGQVYKSTDGTTWTLDGTNTPPVDIDAQIIISSKFWDITEQENQHGGKAWWSHTNSDWSYSPTIYEDKPAGGASLPLLTPIFADHQLNDESYLNADTFSWQAGSVYEAVYQHLVEDVASVANTTMYGYHSNAVEPNDIYSPRNTNDMPPIDNVYKKISNEIFVPISLSGSLAGEYSREASLDTTGVIAETKDFDGINITYITATDGHRICLPDQETAISELYATTGVAWFYILDTQNARFKLPRTKWNFTGLRDGVGGYVEAGLPNITGEINRAVITDGFWASGAFSLSGSSGTVPGYNSGTPQRRLVAFDASRSSSIYGASNTVQPKATEMYLYFYVGNFTQTALENTAGLNAEMFNDLNTHKVIEFQAPTADNGYTWYRKYADGWVEQGGHATTVDGSGLKVLLPVPMEPNQFFITNSSRQPTDNWTATPCVSKSADGTYIEIAIVPNSGTGQWVSGTIDWQVSGMSAQ